MPLFNCPYLHFLCLCEDPGPPLNGKLLPNGEHLPAEEPLPELGKSSLLHLAHVGVEETAFIIINDLTEATTASPAPLGTGRGETRVAEKVNFINNNNNLSNPLFPLYAGPRSPLKIH